MVKIKMLNGLIIETPWETMPYMCPTCFRLIEYKNNLIMVKCPYCRWMDFKDKFIRNFELVK